MTNSSARTSYRFGKAGIKVIPNVCWSVPQLDKMALSIWPEDMSLALLDLNHVNLHGKKRHDGGSTERQLQRGFDLLNEKWPETTWICYVGNQSTLPMLKRYFGDRVIITRSRVFMLMRLKDRHIAEQKAKDEGGDKA